MTYESGQALEDARNVAERHCCIRNVRWKYTHYQLTPQEMDRINFAAMREGVRD